MIFRYKGEEYTFPDELSEITLGDRITFYEQYGKALDERAAKLDDIKDEFERECESNSWHMQMALETLAFYTGIDLAELSADADMTAMLQLYNTCIIPFLAKEKDVQIKQEYEFSGCKWVIASPELLATSKITLGEFIHAKEIVRQLHQLGKGNWYALPYLCAIYLRKEGEPFDEALLATGSERLKLFEDLPLDIALGVGFFLSSTLSIYLTTSRYFTKVEPGAGLIPPVISISGDG